MIFSTQIPRMMGGKYPTSEQQQVAAAPTPTAGTYYRGSAPKDRAGTAAGAESMPARARASVMGRATRVDADEATGRLYYDGAPRAEPEQRARDAVEDQQASPATRPPPPPPSGGGAGALPKQFDAPGTPWRDSSGDRQMIRAKQLDLEVKKVEDAYDRSKTIIEKAHGILVSEDMDVRRHGDARAKITARLPVDQVDGVIAQLRELGRVLRLSSDSTDRTKDYYGQGETILEGGASEDDLVKAYEAEQNSYRKEQLLQQIKSLRERMKGQKGQLTDLSDLTHSVLLELTLIGRRGPVEFLPEAFTGVGTAALWVLVTGIFWGPLAIASWVLWRRSAADRT
jgi:hypothetical protein